MKNPFNKKEQYVMKQLILAWNKFLTIEQTHPSHRKDFEDGIHKCQKILMHKMCQRKFKTQFPTHKITNFFRKG